MFVKNASMQLALTNSIWAKTLVLLVGCVQSFRNSTTYLQESCSWSLQALEGNNTIASPDGKVATGC